MLTSLPHSRPSSRFQVGASSSRKHPCLNMDPEAWQMFCFASLSGAHASSSCAHASSYVAFRSLLSSVNESLPHQCSCMTPLLILSYRAAKRISTSARRRILFHFWLLCRFMLVRNCAVQSSRIFEIFPIAAVVFSVHSLSFAEESHFFEE